MTDPGWNRVPIEPQSVNAPLSAFAVFLVVSLAPGEVAASQARSVIADIGGLVRTVGFRDVTAHLSCNVGIGADAWTRFGQTATPRELRPFTEIRGRVTPLSRPRAISSSTSGPNGSDLCFELERLILNALGRAVLVVDEVQGFRYFDARDLLGFVDGTENPTGGAINTATLVGDEDADFRGGSYVVVQKYLHDLDAWAALSTTEQEQVIGRTKADNVELEQGVGTRQSHKALTTIVDAEGREHDILRDNMPFGRPGHGEFGTYFIGYSRHLWVIERMLQRMFLGDPPGDYDRILDVSTAVTGTTFFVPSHDLLQSLDDG